MAGLHAANRAATQYVPTVSTATHTYPSPSRCHTAPPLAFSRRSRSGAHAPPAQQVPGTMSAEQTHTDAHEPERSTRIDSDAGIECGETDDRDKMEEEEDAQTQASSFVLTEDDEPDDKTAAAVALVQKGTKRG